MATRLRRARSRLCWQPRATRPTRGGALGAVSEGWDDAPGSKKCHEEAELECSVWVSIQNFAFVAYLVGFSILLNSRLLIFSPGAVPKDAVQLAPAKALKTGARSTPHTAPQPQPAVDLEAAAARLREALARWARAAQQARAQEGDAGQSGAEAAAQADDA